MRIPAFLIASTLSLASGWALAADSAEQAIRKSLDTVQAGLPVEHIGPSPMAGLYEVSLKGGRVLYASADGQFLLQGNLYQVTNNQAVNLTEKSEARGILAQLNSLPLSEMVVFAPENPKTHITVFTDVDCGYCQKLHREVPELNRLGVEVRYAAFPREGINSASYKKMVSVWCSKDRNSALTDALGRKSVPEATCDNPVAKEFALGNMLGVNGTPTIILADGQVIPGYQSAPELAKVALAAGK
jgi:thiol:disulfide interchange protein DsbC